MGRDSARYSLVAMIFHWVIAILLLWNIWLGWQMEDLHGPAKAALMGLHKSIGMTVLVLSVLRLAWRLVTPQPKFAVHLKPWERWLAHAVHWSFYVVMIGLPLTGWAMVSYSNRWKGLRPFDLFDWPRFPGAAGVAPEKVHAMHETLEFIHADALKLLAYALIILHVLGALKHQFIDKDAEMNRMLPFGREPGRRA